MMIHCPEVLQVCDETDVGVSLVICCHNSVDKLSPTLDHVLKVIVPNTISWELIIVDNASTDTTSQFAENKLRISDINYKIVSEPAVGLSNARIKGLSVATFEFISFIDDDNWICPDWIRIVYEVMTAYPDVGACGGLGYPFFESDPPEWFDLYQGCYAVGPQGQGSGYVSDARGYLWGAGLTLRRSAWNEIIDKGFSFHLTGRHGSNLSSGEDSEVCLALRSCNWKLWYDSRLTYHHYLPSSRLSWNYLKKLQNGFGASDIVLGAYREFLFLTREFNSEDFKGIWIADSIRLLEDYRLRYNSDSFLCAEPEGSSAVMDYEGQIGKLHAITRLNSDYDAIKQEIYCFVRKCRRVYSVVDDIETASNEDMITLAESEDGNYRDLQLQLRLNAIESSLSWRLTAPLRKLVDALRSKKRG